MRADTDVADSPGDWMRTFAVRLAVDHPELSPTEVIHRAITEYESACSLAPEVAAALCNRDRPAMTTREPNPPWNC